jgi:PAS domain S-box-containing protein
METLQDVMTASVITIAPDRSVSHALEIMEQHKISALVVAENNKPLGIFTERTLIQIRAGGEIDYSRPICRVMSSPPFTAPMDTEYREAYQLLLKHHIRHLVVTDHDGNLVGIVTGTDFLFHLGLEYFMEFKNVAQVMVRDVLTLKASSSAFAAMKLMNDRSISSLVIEEDGYPKGIITERDLLRFIRSQKNLRRIRLHDVMSHPVQTVFADVSSHKAAKVLLQKKLRRLVVINSSGCAVGIITETDMIKGLRTSYTDHLKEVIQLQANQLKEVKQQIEEAVILDSMLQSAGDIAISIMDPELHILLHNQAAGELYNSTAEQLIGKDAAMLHKAAGNLEQFEQAVAAAKKDGRYEFILKQQRSGTIHYLATTIFCICDQKNNKTGFGLIAIDVTRQKQHEVSLQAERNFSKKIIDTVPSIISSITPDGTIQFINPAGEQLTGYSADELLGKNWQDFFYAGKTGRSTREMLKRFQEDDVRGYEVRLKTKDGNLRDISWSSVKRFSEKGAFFETLILGNDVTGQKKAVQELEHKKKEAEDANIALKVMLDQHTRTKESVEEQISIKLKELVLPYLHLLRESPISEKQAETINLIDAHIDSITHSFSPRAREIILGLSPRETMVADLVRQGKTSKDISEMLNISLRTVETYRNNLRKKLGINKKKISLRTYLMTNFAR